ncbi:MAG: sulfatase family protein [Acidobacteriota bacterium]
MERRSFLRQAGFSALAAAAGPGMERLNAALPRPAGKRLNILLILTDQHRYDGVGVNGNEKISTPNLDRIAREGARFERAYVAQPVCSPNRAAIFTGLYPHSSGVWENNVPLPSTTPAISELMKAAGYDCGYFGKWHLGRRDAFDAMPEYPKDGRGSGHYFGEGASRRYAVDVLTEDVLTFLRRERSGPFFACVSYYPPHPPYSVPADYLEPYEGIEDERVRAYYAMVSKVDEKVGELLRALDELEIRDQTLVIFTSEHGHYFQPRWNDHAKRLCYDTASRIPLLMRLPGRFSAGLQVEGLFSSVDLTPTILGLIGYQGGRAQQGRDFSAHLLEGRTGGMREHFFIENIPFPFEPRKGMERCVGSREWKLILSTRRPPELVNYRTDPREGRNQWDDLRHSSLCHGLREGLRDWAEKTHDQLSLQLLDQTTGV